MRRIPWRKDIKEWQNFINDPEDLDSNNHYGRSIMDAKILSTILKVPLIEPVSLIIAGLEIVDAQLAR